MAPTPNGKPGAACAACGHAARLHSNEACEAIRCHCHVTRKQLASSSDLATKPPATTVVPVFPVADAAAPAAPAAPSPRKRRRRDGSHAA